MKSKILKILYLLLAPVLSGVLLALAFPPFNLGWVGWVGLVPLLIALSTVPPKHGFILSFVSGLFFFVLIFDWVFEVPAYKFLHHVLLGLYVFPFYGLFGLAFSLLSRRFSFTSAAFASPFVFVSLEYVRSNMGFMAFPYAWLGYSQYAYPQITQIASITGAYGVSLLVVMVNSAFAAIVLFLTNRLRKTEPLVSNRGVIALVATATVLMAFTLYYGLMTLSEEIAGKKVRVSVVQGNIEQKKKWNPKFSMAADSGASHSPMSPPKNAHDASWRNAS